MMSNLSTKLLSRPLILEFFVPSDFLFKSDFLFHVRDASPKTRTSKLPLHLNSSSKRGNVIQGPPSCLPSKE